MLRALAAIVLALAAAGCRYVPTISKQPVVHNPFPQLSKVAVVPFVNHSSEPSVDGRQFALAYYNELQVIPGYEVVPMSVVEAAIRAYGIRLPLASAAEARQLGEVLDVDAVVVGVVTDFSPYYPPRCGLHVEWYATNPCFHEIPPGYGMPFGTPGEEEIPAPVKFEAEMALARAQLEAHTPPHAPLEALPAPAGPEEPGPPEEESKLEEIAHRDTTGTTDKGPTSLTDPDTVTPDELYGGPACLPHDGPVMKHTRVFNGHDAEFTAALATYYDFRDDARFGGWQAYLQRSDDFIRFCCHLHLVQMLSARGGAGETRVVWRWSKDR